MNDEFESTSTLNQFNHTLKNLVLISSIYVQAFHLNDLCAPFCSIQFLRTTKHIISESHCILLALPIPTFLYL